MVRTDYGGEGSIKKAGRNWQRILLPIVGLLLIGAAGIVAYILSSPAGKLLHDKIPSFSKINLSQLQLVAGIGIFIIIIMVFAAIYAVLAPKPPKGISESELDKEKKEKQLEEERARRRKRELKNRMRQSRKE